MLLSVGGRTTSRGLRVSLALKVALGKNGDTALVTATSATLTFRSDIFARSFRLRAS